MKILLTEAEQRVVRRVAKEWSVEVEALFEAYTKNLEACLEDNLFGAAEVLVEEW